MCAGPNSSPMKTSVEKSDNQSVSEEVGLGPVSALAGIAAPIIFTVMVTLESLLRLGYSQISNYISDLGVGSFAFLQNANFIVTGLLVGFFAISFQANLPSRAGASRNNAFMAVEISGVGTIGAGITLMLWSVFPTDYFFFWIHTTVTFIAFFAFAAAQLHTYRALKGDASWGNYPKASLVGGVFTLAAIFVFIFTLGTNFYGLTERLVVAVPFVWLVASGAKFYSRVTTATGGSS